VKSLCAIDDKSVNIIYPLEWSEKKDFAWVYSNHRYIFDVISWGGDTHETKLKEKADLITIMNQIQYSKNNVLPEVEPQKVVESEVKASPVEDDMFRLANQSKL
jgi:hypothetical protein